MTETRRSGARNDAEVLVIGGGPGGYAAAFRAADLDASVTLVTDEPDLGGVCLLRGCIPSKALLHLAEQIYTARETAAMGVTFGQPDIDVEAVRDWKDGVVARLTKGLAGLCEKRGIRTLRGRARFRDSRSVTLERGDGVGFDDCIIATGSRPIPLPGGRFGGRIMDSSRALDLEEIPDRLLVVGGGYVGLELGMVYAAFGSEVTLVEMTDRLMPGVDEDLVAPLATRAAEVFAEVRLETEVDDLEESATGVRARLTHGGDTLDEHFGRALIAIGRRPNTDDLGLENTDIETDEDGYIRAGENRRTAEQKIFAIGDAAGGMRLAHEAMYEGRVAAEVIAGQAAAADARAIPAVVYTDPQIAWCGLTETAASKLGYRVDVRRFPWKASGRAVSMGLTDGMTKLVLDPESHQVLGIGIVGRQAETMIAEGVLAVEMGAMARDLADAVHPHPTLSETIGECAEMVLGGATHV
jgi:dihydrolipoamide dehydrogenase